MKTTDFESAIKVVCNKARAGVPAEEIVDEHFNCRTPELRQKLIDEIRKMVGADMIEKAFSE